MDPPDALANHNAEAALPTHADIVVIGSGYSGAAITHYLQKYSATQLDIVMLEARETCSGATGRNGGHLKPDAYYSYKKYKSMYGATEAEALLQFEAAQVPLVAALIDEGGIDCDFSTTRAIDVYKVQSEADFARRTLQERIDDGGDTKDIKVLNEEEISGSGFKDVKFAVSFTAGQLHPYKLVHSLLRRSIQGGLRVYTQTPVTAVTRGDDSTSTSTRWCVTTERGVIHAKRVIFATNGYTGALLPALAQKIIPVRGTACRITRSPLSRVKRATTDTDTNEGGGGSTFTYGVRWNAGESDYLITRTDGSTILGGAKQCFLDDLEKWYDNTDDSQTINDASLAHFRTFMETETQSAGGWVDQVWTGVLGYSTDLLPWVGHLGPLGQHLENAYVCAGLHGHGMTRILGCANQLAREILQMPPSTTIPMPTSYRITQERIDKRENQILPMMGQAPSPAKL